MKPFFQNSIKQMKKGVGVCVPLFSLRSRKDHGIGEFYDLKLLIDWANQSQITLIQILPVNDTSVHLNWKDSYPYSSLSAFALHPIYISLSDFEIPPVLSFEKDVDYEKVWNFKIQALEKIFEKEAESTFSSQAFQIFKKNNHFWLDPYSIFCSLRDHFKTSEHDKWIKYSALSFEEVKLLCKSDLSLQKRIQFYEFIQFHLDRQFRSIVEYAKEKNVLLKGDFAVGVNRSSVDPWVYPELFSLNKSIGAPPDFFNANGQNWGFPSYKWQEHAKTNYDWFCKRLKHLGNYFDLIRIDHILGYFRIWEIPEGAIHGVMGTFNPCKPIRKVELEDLNIPNLERLTEPYIDQNYLDQLTKNKELILQLLKKYPTEKAIDDNVSDSEIKQILFKILSNVILFKDHSESNAFHFRFNMQYTYSFKCLDLDTKDKLQKIYQDYFFHRQDPLWEEEAIKKLPYFLSASSMLVCAEDLGFVPACVKGVLNKLKILELYIQRMPKKNDQEFGIPEEYSYLSVCSPSNHDTSNLRAWWGEDRNQTKRYAKTVLGMEQAPSDCNPDVIEKIIDQHLKSPSMWAIFMLQDLVALKAKYSPKDPKDERINDPANSNHYWKFRYPFYLEDLACDLDLSNKINQLISLSGRNFFL